MTTRTVDPKDVIQTALERNIGVVPSVAANAVMQALKSNGLRIVKDASKEITYCPEHPSVKMPCQLPHTGPSP